MLATISLAFASIVCSVWADRHKISLWKYPLLRLFARGVRPLLIVGGLATAALVVSRILRTPHVPPKSFWPLVLGGAVFIYFWWLAALLFDLGFIWHRYVRHSVWQKHLRQARKPNRAISRRWKSSSRRWNWTPYCSDWSQSIMKTGRG